MAKAGMKRLDIKKNRTTGKNEFAPVPEIQGKAKTSKEKAKPITEK